MKTKFYSLIFALSTVCLVSQPALSDAIKISSTNIPELIKNKSLTYKEIETKSLSFDLQYEQINLGYNWSIGFDFSKEQDATDSVTTNIDPQSEKDKYSFLLNKKFMTSTITTLEATQVNYLTRTANTSYSQNYLTATLEQSIYPFFSTPQEKLNLLTAKTELERSKLQLEVDLNDHTKEAVSLFWKTLSLQKSVQENSDLLKKYQSLVKTIQRKRSNSTSSAGELEQALAEYEIRKQSLIEDTNSVENYLLQLKQLLNIDKNTTLELVQSDKLPELPTPFNGDIKNLKRYEIQKLKILAAEDSYSASRAKGLPKISLYGKYTQQGLDANTTESFNEFKSATKDKYAIGLKLDYIFDDQASEKEKAIKLANRDIELSRFNRFEFDLKNQITIARQKLENAYTSLQTTNTILKYRLDGLKQINTNYTQGRTDISFLIDAYNKKIQAEISVINAKGLYEVTLAEYNNLISD